MTIKEKKAEYDRIYFQKNKNKKAEQGRLWRERNPEAYRKLYSAATIRYRKKVRLEVLTHYSNGIPYCKCCKESQIEFLVLDHIKGGGNIHRKLLGKHIGTNFYVWVRKNNFPSMFQVLCHNCNFAKGKNGICPHRLTK